MIVGSLGFLFLAPLLQDLAKRGMRKTGLWGKPVVVGSGEVGARVPGLLRQEWKLGYEPVAVFNHRLIPVEESLGPTPYEETFADAADLHRKRGVDTIIFAMPHTRREQLATLVNEASVSFRHVLIIPNITNSTVVTRDLAGTFAVEIKHNLLNPWAQRAKRALDLLGAVVGGLLISPLLIAVAVLIKLDSPGPAFYGHRRLGAKNGHFLCWKFRTMHADAERLLDEYLQDHPDLQIEWEQNRKLRNDSRVTRVGRFLRKTSLDELPSCGTSFAER